MRNIALTSTVGKDASEAEVGRFTRNLATNKTTMKAERTLIAGEELTAITP